MQKSEGKIFFRIIVYIFEIMIFYALEQALRLDTHLVAEISILVPAFVSIALFEREFVGMAFGIFAGMLVDYTLGTGIGLCALLFGVFGYIIGVVSNYFFRANVVAQVVVSSIVFLCFESIKIFFINRNFEMFLQVWQCVFLKNVLLSLPVFVLVFYFNRAVSYRFFTKGEALN